MSGVLAPAWLIGFDCRHPLSDPNLSSFIWSVADLLRGDYKQSDSGKVILPLPHAPDARIDREKTKAGYEIPFNRHFYVFKPPRPLSEMDAELKGVTDRIVTMIAGLFK
jgi:hypothetical protein